MLNYDALKLNITYGVTATNIPSMKNVYAKQYPMKYSSKNP